MTSHRDLTTDLADFDLLPQLRKLGVVVLLCLVSACASNYRAHGPVPTRAQVRQYAPPGPPEDPWGPHITAASKRYGMPEAWIREVMRQESGGQQYLDGTLITSAAGAMGLMQLMPRTYEELGQRYGLGDDPYYPRDNIFAGAAYMKELYDRYGAPGFLAAAAACHRKRWLTWLLWRPGSAVRPPHLASWIEAFPPTTSTVSRWREPFRQSTPRCRLAGILLPQVLPSIRRSLPSTSSH
jgi:hypothetical protein